MTTAPVVDALLADLAAAGLEVVAHGDRLRYRPIGAMTPGLLGRVRESKPALLKALSAPPPASSLEVPAPGCSIVDCPKPSTPGVWVVPAPRCYCCGHARWWRFLGQSGWTCSACHPPQHGGQVEWLGTAGGPTP